MVKHSGESLVKLPVLACVAASLCAVPASGDEFSYDNAFDLRVTDIGSRTALDGFVVEAVRQGQYDQALSTLEEVILRNPSDIGARIALARVYYQISSYDLAAAHLEQAMLTAGWEAFQKEIEELKAKIDRGQAGWDYILTIGGGVDYKRVSQTVFDFVPYSESEGSITAPFGMIKGVVIRDLQTATSDEIHVGGVFRYTKNIGDLDFDNNYDQYDQYKGRAYITYSKGLPDLIDTLRVDVTGYAQSDRQDSFRQINEYGTELALTVQPTVESQLRAFVNYGWLGSSTNYYTDHRLTYGVSGEFRVAAGVAVGAYAKGYAEWGESPIMFLGGDTDFETEGYEVGASVSHLLWVFEDGRSWTHEAGARYTSGDVLDYAAIAIAFPPASLVDRSAWEVFWNHSVQIYTDTVLDFGAYYGEAEFSNSGATYDRESAYWGVKGGLTFQFN